MVRDGLSLKFISYINREGVAQAINSIYVALGNGTLNLIWEQNHYLIVTPTVIWATPEDSMLDVKSNTNWIIN